MLTGHYVEDCPTNLDPSYDRPPDPASRYTCLCCGAYKKHLTTLCPKNENPGSLNQQRIKAGIITGQPSTPMSLDRYRPTYGNPRKRDREPAVDANATTYTNWNHGDLVGFDDSGNMNPGRHALLKGTRQPSQSDIKTGSNRTSQDSPPPTKRTRNLGEGQQERSRERTRRKKSRMPRGQSPSIGSEHVVSTELLPQSIHHSNDTAGRLSPWDDGDGDLEMSQRASSSCWQPVTSGFWDVDSAGLMLQNLFPHANATWVSEMASFDVDKFFEELQCFTENRAVAQKLGGHQLSRTGFLTTRE